MTDTFLEDLYREMYPKIVAFARVRLRDEQLAQEVTQDVFVLAQEKLEELRRSPKPQGWLIRAAGYAVQHAQRDRQYIQQRTVPLEESSLSAPPPETEDDDLCRRMSPEEWRLLRAVYCDGYSIKEAARLCGLSLEACRKRLYRCKQRLRRELSAEQEGGDRHVG
ncbi:MAG: sigma-70 family RNA polymerase sigma factor [Oscillospiraceae bacterium]|nr:sigma-70 family RNA polymerase sigma factor [Oscillospiraceae bacterium]